MGTANKIVQLTESVRQDKPLRVDRETGVISGVKILGFQSANRHGQAGAKSSEYCREGAEKALHLYEGRQVFADHPPRSNPKVERSIRDLVGVIRKPVIEADGVYGEIHYPPKSAIGQHVADLAETMPDSFGLSHNADGVGRVKGGKYIIESIEKVRSVDLVTSPATTKGLFESQEQSMTLKELLESRGFKSQDLVSLLEDDGLDMPMDAPPPADATGWRDHLKNAVSAIISDETLDEDAVKKKINQILALMKDQAAPEADDDEDDDSETPPPAMESKDIEELAQLRREKQVRTLCESSDFQPTKIQLKALCGFSGDDDRKAFIAEAKTTATVAQKTGPRAVSGKALMESRGTSDKAPINAKDFVRNITD